METETREIKAIGRVFSSKNTAKLKSLFNDIATILVDANVVTFDDLKQTLEKAALPSNTTGDPVEDLEETLEKLEEVIEDEEDEDEDEDESEIKAGSLADETQVRTWHDSIDEALYTFKDRFHEIYSYAPNYWAKETEHDLKDIKGKELIDELYYLLIDLQNNYPLKAAKSLSRDEKLWPTATLDKITTIESSALLDEIIEEKATEDNLEDDLEVDFQFPLGVNEINASANELPIEGVLFIVDEPSETAPSKGTSLPLYIPKAIAERCIQAVANSKGLPLDIHNSLMQHANEEIVGVMTEAELRGKEFIVKGHLFPWSQPQKTSLIRANKNLLGMSMNAHATGREAIVDGQKVYQIESLDLLGANILKADRATYRKTRLIAANSGDTKEKSQVDIEEQLQKMSDTLNLISATSQQESAQIAELRKTVEVQNAVILELQQERNERMTALQAQSNNEARNKERNDLIQALGEVVDAKLQSQKNELLDVINPKRQPPQITRPLVSLVAESNIQQSSNTNVLEKQLIAAEAKLSVLEEQGVTGVTRIALIEEVRDLKTKLGV